MVANLIKNPKRMYIWGQIEKRYIHEEREGRGMILGQTADNPTSHGILRLIRTLLKTIGVGHIWTKRLFTSMALWTITMRRLNWVGLHLNKFSFY